MNRALIVLLVTILAVPLVAYAGPTPQQKQHYCLMLGWAFSNAAFSRDNGLSPKDAYDGIMAAELGRGKVKSKPTIPSAKVKHIVNMVYFNPDFTYAGGTALSDQVFNMCMGIHQYKPLK